tara:strand:+ start:1274 stop:1693 length:420 start_codon:yes stop_codon:yes gene_type:complete
MKITKTWTLPKPEKIGEGYVWKVVVRVGRHVPFGYRQHPEDCDILLPIPEELELFEKAKEFLKRYSYREVSAWLSTQSGRYISHVGLYKRVKIEQKRKTEASTQRYLAQRYKEALKKAERFESRRLGQKDYLDTSPTQA